MRRERSISGTEETLWQYIDRKAAHKSVLGSWLTGSNYLKFKKCLSRYFDGKEPALYLSDITEKFATGFENWLRSRGMNLSTISYYNRIFRSLYNQAATEGLIKNTHPFDGAYTKVTAVRKYAKVMTPEGTVLLYSLPREELIPSIGYWPPNMTLWWGESRSWLGCRIKNDYKKR